jgi:hypothetical protein
MSCYLTVSRAVLSTFFAHGALGDMIAFSVCVVVSEWHEPPYRGGYYA